MTLAIRFLPKANRAVLTANGRSYPVSGAAMVEVPYPDAVAIAGDQATRLMIVGQTTDRPLYSVAMCGMNIPPAMYDLTLGEVIFSVPGSFPTQWVDISGDSV